MLIPIPKTLPPRPKLLQKTALQKNNLEAINFEIIKKTLCIQLEKKLDKDHKNITKIIVSGNYFVIISARMVREGNPPQNTTHSNKRVCTHTHTLRKLFRKLFAHTLFSFRWVVILGGLPVMKTQPRGLHSPGPRAEFRKTWTF